jgi:hypothetical protein
MPRLVVPQRRDTRSARRQAERQRDYVVLALKAATFLVAVGVLGAFVLLAGTDELDPADAPPAASAQTPNELGQDAPRLRLPAANTATTSIVPTLTSESPEPPAPPDENEPEDPPPTDPGRGDDRFVEEGAPCDEPGDYAFTDKYRPVVCYPTGRSATWQYMF